VDWAEGAAAAAVGKGYSASDEEAMNLVSFVSNTE
jgi:hypothetical protein